MAKKLMMQLAAMACLAVSAIPAASAAPVFLRGVAAAAAVDQHPVARGEAFYDSWPLATASYNRNVDLLGFPYDLLPDYLSLIRGDWFCSPTSAYSLVTYWASRPGRNFPNLVKAGDTARSIILQMAASMDTDDWALQGLADANELHFGTRWGAISSGMLSYFNDRNPGKFVAAGLLAGGAGGIGAFGQLYDALIRADVPVILNFPGHSTVGVGFDPAFGWGDANHYIVNDPWAANQQIAGGAVGRGRPILGNVVFGSLAEDLYGPGADTYLAYPGGDGNLPLSLAYVTVPEPGSVLLVCCGFLSLVLCSTSRKVRRRTAIRCRRR